LYLFRRILPRLKALIIKFRLVIEHVKIVNKYLNKYNDGFKNAGTPFEIV